MSNIIYFYIFVALLGLLLFVYVISFICARWKFNQKGGKLIKRNRKKTK
jgi:lipopolysaccharide/colanic/teichoic acid biosynthesis glycosyltransferase